MSTTRQGREFEAKVAQELRQQGWRILARNFFGGGGELDIVASKGERLCFVEVRGRQELDLLTRESITARKRRALCGAAEAFLLKHPDTSFQQSEFVVCFVDRLGMDWIFNAFDEEVR